MHDVELVRGEDSGEALVLVLVDDDHAQPRVGSARERVEEAVELLRAVDRRDDEVERRKLADDTGRRLRDAVPTAPARLRAPRRSRRRGVRADRARERPRPDGLGPRAGRRRRRVDRRDAGESSPRSTIRGCASSATTTQLGLAASLNRGLDEARGTLRRPTRCRRRRACRGGSSASSRGSRLAPPVRHRRLGGARARPRPGASAPPHAMPAGAVDVRWARALQRRRSSTRRVLVERDVLERHGLRYDTSFEESEDYDLWSRLLDSRGRRQRPRPARPLPRPRRSRRRSGARELQRECQLRVALRRSPPSRPRSSADEASSRGVSGAGEPLERGRARGRCRRVSSGSPRVRGDRVGLAARSRARATSRALATAARRPRSAGDALAERALRLDPRCRRTLPSRRRAGEPSRSARAAARPRAGSRLRARADAARSASRPSSPSRRRTGHRSSTASRRIPEIDLTVVYAAGTVAGRTWHVEPKHRAVFLRGLRVPGAERVLHHDYPRHARESWRALERRRPEVVVVSGWSTFAAQAAIAWCGLQGRPVRARRREPRRGATRRMAADGEGHGRPADRRACRRASSSRGRSLATR